MARLVIFGAVLAAFVSFCPSSAQQSVGTVVVNDGRVGFGLITGGNFAPGSFSINGSPGGRPQTNVYVQEDDGGTQHNIVIQSGQSVDTEPDISGGSNSGNTQLYPVQPLTIHTYPGQGGNEGGTGGGQKVISSVVLNTLKHKHNRGNNPKNGNNIQTDELDSVALEAIFGSNGVNNSPPTAENSLGNAGEQGSIQIASITGGNFEEGTFKINNNNRPGTVVPQKGSDVGNGNTGNHNSENEAHDSVGHCGNIQPDALDAAAIETIFGSNGGNIGSPSTENGLNNTGEQEIILIASITGGTFEEGTFNINNNNKRPGTEVPQNLSDVNNGNTGNINAKNETQDSIGHGGNIQPDALDAAAIETIFGSNGGNIGSPSTENGLNNTGEQEIIQIASITGGNFEEGTFNMDNNNKRPGTEVPQNLSDVNNGNTANINAENETQDSIGHGANNNDADTVGVGSNQGQTSSGYNSGGYDEPWIWNR